MTFQGLVRIGNVDFICVQAGSLLATGIVNCGVRSESDPAVALLTEHVESKSVPLKTGAIIGLGLAYVGSQRDDLSNLLLPVAMDDSNSMEIASLAALSLGFVFVGSCNGEIAGSILQVLMERDETALSEKWARFMALGLALLYVGTLVLYFSILSRRPVLTGETRPTGCVRGHIGDPESHRTSHFETSANPRGNLLVRGD